MKIRKFLSSLLFAAALTPHAAFAASTSQVEGKIVEVVPSKKEIYVSSEGTKYEFYFLPATRIVSGGSVIPFSELKEGMRVKVTAVKVGQRLDPQTVEILE